METEGVEAEDKWYIGEAQQWFHVLLILHLNKTSLFISLNISSLCSVLAKTSQMGSSRHLGVWFPASPQPLLRPPLPSCCCGPAGTGSHGLSCMGTIANATASIFLPTLFSIFLWTCLLNYCEQTYPSRPTWPRGLFQVSACDSPVLASSLGTSRNLQHALWLIGLLLLSLPPRYKITSYFLHFIMLCVLTETAESLQKRGLGQVNGILWGPFIICI